MIKRRKRTNFTKEFIDGLTASLWEWADQGGALWIGNFAADHKIHRQRLSELASKDADFNEAMDYAKQKQENFLVMGALGKKIDTGMAIFTLKNVAGWRDMPAEQENEMIKDKDLIIPGIPQNGEGKHRFAKYFE